LAVGADDRGQLGVPATQVAGATGIGMNGRIGHLLLQLGMLVDQRLDSFEHHVTSCAWSPDTTTAPAAPEGATGAGEVLLLAVALLEPGHAAAGVEDVLLARVERVAGRADIGAEGALGRRALGRERVAAGAGDLGLDVRGVNVLLHDVLS